MKKSTLIAALILLSFVFALIAPVVMADWSEKERYHGGDYIWGEFFKTREPAQMRGDTEATDQGWWTRPLVTIGEVKIRGKGFKRIRDVNERRLEYRPPGILDGIGAFKKDDSTVRMLVNHELNAEDGYAYTLGNGTELTGSRVSYFDLGVFSRKVKSPAGLAYNTIVDRAGAVVAEPAQINEGFLDGDPEGNIEGFDRFCSSYGFQEGEGGLVDDIYFTGEETTDGYDTEKNDDGGFSGSTFPETPADGFGGQEVAVDVDNETAYIVPMLGRAAFENVCLAENFGTDKVVIVIGDDRQGAPLYLYIGQKGAAPANVYNPPQFLIDNGLGLGHLYVWVADNGDRDPEAFKGTGSVRPGQFKKIVHFDPTKVDPPTDGWDSQGFASLAVQDALAEADTIKAFRFSRPEDVSGNPEDLTQIVMASTGRGGVFPSDNWGTTYLIDIDLSEQTLANELANIDNIPATITILYDGDDAGGGIFTDPESGESSPDFGLRSPDNLDWADDGFIYIQEDRSTSPSSLFGGASGIEASLWKLDPRDGTLTRILEIYRKAVPKGQGDPQPFEIGEWESSGVLDVTELFDTHPEETLLILDVQAHSLQGGGLALKDNQDQDLVQGGQLMFASNYGGGYFDDDEEDEEEGEENDDKKKKAEQ